MSVSTGSGLYSVDQRAVRHRIVEIKKDASEEKPFMPPPWKLLFLKPPLLKHSWMPNERESVCSMRMEKFWQTGTRSTNSTKREKESKQQKKSSLRLEQEAIFNLIQVLLKCNDHLLVSDLEWWNELFRQKFRLRRVWVWVWVIGR